MKLAYFTLLTQLFSKEKRKLTPISFNSVASRWEVVKDKINRIKINIGFRMMVGEEFEDLRKTALKLAREEVLEEMDRRFTTEYNSHIPLDEYTHVSRESEKYQEFIKKNKKDYDNMIKEGYDRWLFDLKKAWLVKNMNNIFQNKGDFKDDKQ